MSVFSDSSALVSLFNPNDPNHEKAIKLSVCLHKTPGFISRYIFAETVTIISQRVGKEKSIEAGKYLKENFVFLDLDEETENLAWEIFKKHTSKNISFVDCTIIALYQKGAFDKCFTFDQHFKNSKVPLLD